jgi:DNA ligase (NAD+)
MMKSYKEIEKLSLEEYKKFLEKESIENLQKFRDILDDLYYNTSESTFSDYRYDLLDDKLKRYEEKEVDKKVKVGCKMREEEIICKLPYFMGGANKITPNESEAFDRWIKKNRCKSYVISEKLDGISCMFHKRGDKIALYTRGDGKEGSDISYLLDFLKFPKIKNDITVRGELIIQKSVFKDKYSNEYKNPRNMVSGIVKRKTAKEGLNDVHFVAYEVIQDSIKPQSEQIELLEKLKFLVVKYVELDEIGIDILSTLLVQMKKDSLYQIDGIVVQGDKDYDRVFEGNPPYMFAFKMNNDEDIFETEVIDIEWNISKHGQIKPTVLVKSVVCDGYTMDRATGHTAKYIEENSIGPGTIIKITRSKDVIPYIVQIVKSTTPKFPDIPYEWDKNRVNIKTIENGDIMSIKIITGFFENLGIKYLGESTVTKMYNHGLDDLFKIITADERTLLDIPTFKELTVKRIKSNIEKGLTDMNLAKVLGSSCVFGFGIAQKKIEALLLDFPDVLTEYKKYTKEKLIERINKIEGFSDITSEKIAENIADAKKFIDKLSKYGTFKTEKRVSDNLVGLKIVMSGFRDEKLSEEIKKRGGSVVTSVSKKTSIVIVSDKSNESDKIKKAKELGVKIMDIQEFVDSVLN